MRESDIERKFKDWAAETHPSVRILKTHERNWPDNVVFLPGGRCFFLEFKRPGEKPRPAQAEAFDQLRVLDFEVHVADDLEAAQFFLHTSMNPFFYAF